MAKIEHESLYGKIRDIVVEHEIEMFYYNSLKDSIRALKWINKHIKNSIGVDIETSGFDFQFDELLGIGIGLNFKRSIYFNTRDWSKEDIKELMLGINKLSNKKVMHNSFFDCKFILGYCGVFLDCDYDTYTYSHTLYIDRQYNNESLGLKELTRLLTPYGDYEESLVEFKTDYCKANNIKKVNFSYSMIPDDILAPYCCLDTISTLRLFNLFERKVNKLIESGEWIKIKDVINTLHEANKLYIEASVKGIQINIDTLIKLNTEFCLKHKELHKELSNLKEVKLALSNLRREELKKSQSKRKSKLPLSRCRKLWKELDFKLSSSAHKIELFINQMKLEPLEKTDKGSPKVDSYFINHYADKGVDVMVKIDEYLKLEKVIKGFIGMSDSDDEDTEDKGLWKVTKQGTYNRVHPNYNINGTITNRLSTTSPNVAQVGSRGLGKQIKKCYEVEEGYHILAWDFSSFELRILGFIANEPNFKEAFNKGYDLHSVTAHSVFKSKMNIESKDYPEVLKEVKTKYGDTYRYMAKSINFAIPYSTSAFGLSKSLSSTKKEAQEMLDNYFGANQGIYNFMENNKKEAYEKGYVENYFGARMIYRLTQGYNVFNQPKNKNWSALAEYRTSTNWKIQSFNSFYLYNSLISFFKEIKGLGLDVSLMFTIYDSVLLRVNDSIDDNILIPIIKKHFVNTYDEVTFDIDLTRNPEGKRDWYSYGEVEL